MTYRERKIGIIGVGKLGSALAFSGPIHDHLVAVSSRDAVRRDELASQLPDVAVVERPEQVAEIADLVFITTPDAAIKETCDSVHWTPGHWVVHCSGVLSLDVLDSAKQAGASVAGFHPLQTFPGPPWHAELSGIAYAIDCEGGDLDLWLEEFAGAYESRTFAIEGEFAHHVYHASAVLACGLMAGLVGISAELWEQAGIDRQRALKMLKPLLHSTVEAISEQGFPNAISGPYVRGDIGTIEKHLESTAKVAPDTSRAYAALALAQLHIAADKGNLDRETTDAMKRLLSEHLESL